MNSLIRAILHAFGVDHVHHECCAQKSADAERPMIELIDAVDDLEHALNFARSSSNPMAQGLEIVMNKFTSILNKGSLKFITPLGLKFDPNLHSAVDYRSSDKDEGEIIMVLRSGYSIDGKMVRFPQVVVSSGVGEVSHG